MFRSFRISQINKFRVHVCVLIVLIELSDSGAAFGQIDAARNLLNDGIIQEIVYGDLEEAISIYSELLYKYSKHRRIAALALLRIGNCYEQLERIDEARVNYARVQRDYEDIVDLMLIVRSRLRDLEVAFPLFLTEPNNGELFEVGNNHTITWNGGPPGGDVRIDLYKGGVFFESIIERTFNDGLHEWVIPMVHTVAANDYRIRITDADNEFVWDESDVDFRIAPLEVTSPNGGEHLSRGETYSITWIRSYSRHEVKIELIKNGDFFGIISPKTKNIGLYVWTIPDTCNISSEYQIKITDLYWNTFDISDAYFSITP